MYLKDKVILITGASRGIGQGISEAVGVEGAKVVLTGKNVEDLAESIEILKRLNVEFICLPLDVTDDNQIDQTFQNAFNHFGKVDGLVNNAGIFVPEVSLEMERSVSKRQFDINVFGLMSCCRAAANLMRHQPDGGKIVNISSNNGKVGFPKYVGYSASKAAVIRVTQTLADEWAKYNINVNAVCPGGVDTPMLHSVAQHIAESSGENPDHVFNRLLPPHLGRHIKPIEIGRIVSFLLSDYAQIIRGQSINIDGGETPF